MRVSAVPGVATAYTCINLALVALSSLGQVNYSLTSNNMDARVVDITIEAASKHVEQQQRTFFIDLASIAVPPPDLQQLTLALS